MRLEINGINYEIIEVENDSDNLKIEDKLCWGTCRYDIQKIYLAKDMTLGKKKQTLSHELTHAFLYEYLLGYKEKYSNEEVCEFLSKYGERIINLANKYIDFKYKYTKGC